MIKGLTLWQPWAWAVAHAGKQVENRTWKPPRQLLGEWIAIHAGQRFDRSAVQQIRELGIEPAAECSQKGAIVAVARLVGVVEKSADPWFVGPVGWVLGEVQAVKPLSDPAPGSVTLIGRVFQADPDHALVYWKGERLGWVPAAPRPATAEEVYRACDLALALWSER